MCFILEKKLMSFVYTAITHVETSQTVLAGQLWIYVRPPAHW